MAAILTVIVKVQLNRSYNLRQGWPM